MKVPRNSENIDRRESSITEDITALLHFQGHKFKKKKHFRLKFV